MSLRNYRGSQLKKATNMGFQKFFNEIANRFSVKSYTGIMEGGLSIDSKKYGSGDYLSALELSLYTNKAIDKRATKISEVEFLLRDEKGNEIENNDLLNLLYKPNKLFTGRQFWKLWQTYFDTIGEVYIYLESDAKQFGETRGKIKSMHLLMPTSVTPSFDEHGNPTEYKMNVGSGKNRIYKPEEIIYTHNPNPTNPLRGVSLLVAGMNTIETESQINKYHSSIIKNGGKVEGVFTFKTGMLTKTQLEELKDQYKKEYSGAKKAGLPLFLGGDSTYTKTGLSPEELSFLEAKKMTLEDICIMTGVPKSMLASTIDAKFDNADADREIFLRETIYPMLVTLTTSLDEKLFPDGMNLTFIDPTPENIDRKLKVTESGLKNSWMSINEARLRHGLDPVDNGEEILVPMNMVKLGTEPTPQPTPNDNKKQINKKFDAGTHPLQDIEVRKIYGQMQVKRMDAREVEFIKVMNQYVADQKERLTSSLGKNKSKKKGIEDFISIETEVKIGNQLFFPLLLDLLKRAGVDAMELGGSKFDFNLSDNIYSWLEKRANIFLTQINETTFQKLKEAFAENLASGEGRDALIAKIQDVYGDFDDFRSALIARTETHNITQYGTLEGYKQAGLTIKVWVAVMDDATRDSHRGLDGEERPMNTPFSNGLQFPGDPGGPPGETINCRCVV